MKRNTTLKKPAKKKASKNPAKKASKAAAGKSAKKISRKKLKATPKKAAKKAAKKAVKKPFKKLAKAKSARKPVAKAIRKPVKKSAAKRPVKKAALITKSVPRLAVAQVPAHVARDPLVQAVLKQLDDSKAEQIVSIDLLNKSTMADCMIVASGRSNRHVNAIADQVAEKMHQHGQKNLRIEGVPQCDWVLVDSGNLIVHIFRPEVRSFYNLEKLWSESAPHEKSGS